MAAPPTVAITDSDLASTEDERVLREAGLTAVRLQATTEDGLIAALAQVPADALIVQWAPVTAEVLDAAPGCRFISRLGIGIDMIDVEAATRRGVAVANTPDYCVDEVVAHTLAMALWLVRGLGRVDAAGRDRQWAAAAAYPAAARRLAGGPGPRGGRARRHRGAGRGPGGGARFRDPRARPVRHRRAGRRPAHLARRPVARLPPGHAARAAHAGDTAPDPGGHDRA